MNGWMKPARANLPPVDGPCYGSANVAHRPPWRLGQTLRSPAMGVFDHDMRSNVVYCSPEVHQIYGWPPDLVARLDMFGEHAHPDDRQERDAAVARAHDPAGDGRYNYQYRIVRTDGTVRWVHTRSQTFFKGSGAARKAVRVIGAITDITDARAALGLLGRSRGSAAPRRDLAGWHFSWTRRRQRHLVAGNKLFGFATIEPALVSRLALHRPRPPGGRSSWATRRAGTNDPRLRPRRGAARSLGASPGGRCASSTDPDGMRRAARSERPGEAWPGPLARPRAVATAAAFDDRATVSIRDRMS